MEQPTEQEVQTFLALATQEEKCAFFKEHPALASIFRDIHFAQPTETTE